MRAVAVRWDLAEAARRLREGRWLVYVAAKTALCVERYEDTPHARGATRRVGDCEEVFPPHARSKGARARKGAARKTRVLGQIQFVKRRPRRCAGRLDGARRCHSSPTGSRQPGAATPARAAAGTMLSIRFNQRQTDTHVTPTLDRLAGKHGQENEDPGLMSDGLESVGSPDDAAGRRRPPRPGRVRHEAAPEPRLAVAAP